MLIPPSTRIPWRSSAALLAILCSCSPAPEQLTAKFEEASAWRDLEAIVAFGDRASGTPGNAALRQFLVDELKQAGLDPIRESFREQTPRGPVDFENIYADVPASRADAPLVILSTHFDTKRLPFPFEGANDGGSGTAVLLSLARELAIGPARDVQYRLLFLDGEEAVREQWVDPDNRYGSRYHVEQLSLTGETERVGACVLLDMVGDKNLRFFRESYSDRVLLEMFFDSARAQGLERHIGGPSEPIKDDHLSFLEANIPSVDLIDLEYGPNNRFWHSPEDRLANVSAASLVATARIVWGALPALERWVAR